MALDSYVDEGNYTWYIIILSQQNWFKLFRQKIVNRNREANVLLGNK